MADKPSFIERAPDVLVQEMVADYQAKQGKTLYPAQPERLFIDWLAYRLSLHREQVQDAANLNLIRFSRAPILDELALDRGESRLPAYHAGCVLEFRVPTLQSAPYTIPAGTIVAVSSGSFSVATVADVTLPAGQAAVTVQASATEAGSAGNGYVAGQISQLITPLAGMPAGLTVANITPTDGGDEEESDGRLQQRLLSTLDKYSVGGPAPAYQRLAMDAHPSVIAVAAASPAPGKVVVYPLTRTGLPGKTVIDAVQAMLVSRTRRQLCATVTTASPVERGFAISARLTLKPGTFAADVLPVAQAAVAAKAASYEQTLGGAVVPEDFTAVLQPLVKRAELLTPAYIECADHEWRHCSAIDLQIAED